MLLGRDAESDNYFLGDVKQAICTCPSWAQVRRFILEHAADPVVRHIHLKGIVCPIRSIQKLGSIQEIKTMKMGISVTN